MDIIWSSLLLLILVCTLSYLWLFVIVKYCVASVLLPSDFGVYIIFASFKIFLSKYAIIIVNILQIEICIARNIAQ